MNSLERLKQQFQKTTSSLSNFHKTATNLERQAYFQGQYDILLQIVPFPSMDGLMEWVRKKRDEILQILEKNSVRYQISKHPLLTSEPAAFKMKTTFLEEPLPQYFQQQPQMQMNQSSFEEENCNAYYTQNNSQYDYRKRRKDQQYRNS
ncbi:unnamed protein product (macronuclear) [Paramecium tetraurelia]|uniref:Uncharacterized protein n=1 Tax=Paramecium tetraurelia TaxID=5888 RepID=A0D1L4_PARTE|nr:uncharacterized protein GSPATT00012455001 [Paramecium tetraurelia]CAK76931.1 unnamed protein product [Paramecium tetraurelia]|eukprot:XP_001444328.1 hypothetical protein (macronuclear) [Paramecium tetraurelia strain d4-2]